MKIFIGSYTKVSASAVFIALSIQGLLLKSLYGNGYIDVWPKVLVGILTGTGAYYLIYKILGYIYEKKLWQYEFRKLNIAGTWFHEIESMEKKEYKRRGITQVSQDLFHLTFQGINYNTDYQIKTRSLWESEAITMNENGRLIFTYKVTRSNSPDQAGHTNKTGIMQLYIYVENNKPVKLEGIFQDSYPSNFRGSITWYRHVPWSDNILTIEQPHPE